MERVISTRGLIMSIKHSQLSLETWESVAGAAADITEFCISRWTPSHAELSPVHPQPVADINKRNPPAHRACWQ